MIEGVLRHCTDASIDRQYTDTHGQSLVGFAFAHLLGFKLLPRMKNVASQKLVKVDADDEVPACLAGMVSTQAIDWELIAQQYDQMVKYATALRLGTAEAEQVLRRFTRGGPKHPTYKAIEELGQAVKSVFIAEYMASQELRREIHEGLQVVENWNSANTDLFYGNAGTIRRRRQGAPGSVRALPAPAPVRAGVRQHPAGPVGPEGEEVGEAHRRRPARAESSLLVAREPVRDHRDRAWTPTSTSAWPPDALICPRLTRRPGTRGSTGAGRGRTPPAAAAPTDRNQIPYMWQSTSRYMAANPCTWSSHRQRQVGHTSLPWAKGHDREEDAYNA